MDRRIPYRPGLKTGLVNVRTISAPSQHEGVGNALCSAFEAGLSVPEEFTDLLKKLDR